MTNLMLLFKLVNHIVEDAGLLGALNFRVPHSRLRVRDRAMFVGNEIAGSLSHFQKLSEGFPELDFFSFLTLFRRQLEDLLG